jgi:hypothetical protein
VEDEPGVRVAIARARQRLIHPALGAVAQGREDLAARGTHRHDVAAVVERQRPEDRGRHPGQRGRATAEHHQRAARRDDRAGREGAAHAGRVGDRRPAERQRARADVDQLDELVVDDAGDAVAVGVVASRRIGQHLVDEQASDGGPPGPRRAIGLAPRRRGRGGERAVPDQRAGGVAVDRAHQRLIAPGLGADPRLRQDAPVGPAHRHLVAVVVEPEPAGRDRDDAGDRGRRAAEHHQRLPRRQRRAGRQGRPHRYRVGERRAAQVERARAGVDQLDHLVARRREHAVAVGVEVNRRIGEQLVDHQRAGRRRRRAGAEDPQAIDEPALAAVGVGVDGVDLEPQPHLATGERRQIDHAGRERTGGRAGGLVEHDHAGRVADVDHRHPQAIAVGRGLDVDPLVEGQPRRGQPGQVDHRRLQRAAVGRAGVVAAGGLVAVPVRGGALGGVARGDVPQPVSAPAGQAVLGAGAPHDRRRRQRDPGDVRQRRGLAELVDRPQRDVDRADRRHGGHQRLEVAGRSRRRRRQQRAGREVGLGQRARRPAHLVAGGGAVAAVVARRGPRQRDRRRGGREPDQVHHGRRRRGIALDDEAQAVALGRGVEQIVVRRAVAEIAIVVVAQEHLAHRLGDARRVGAQRRHDQRARRGVAAGLAERGDQARAGVPREPGPGLAERVHLVDAAGRIAIRVVARAQGPPGVEQVAADHRRAVQQARQRVAPALRQAAVGDAAEGVVDEVTVLVRDDRRLGAVATTAAGAEEVDAARRAREVRVAGLGEVDVGGERRAQRGGRDAVVDEELPRAGGLTERGDLRQLGLDRGPPQREVDLRRGRQAGGERRPRQVAHHRGGPGERGQERRAVGDVELVPALGVGERGGAGGRHRRRRQRARDGVAAPERRAALPGPAGHGAARGVDAVVDHLDPPGPRPAGDHQRAPVVAGRRQLPRQLQRAVDRPDRQLAAEPHARGQPQVIAGLVVGARAAHGRRGRHGGALVQVVGRRQQPGLGVGAAGHQVGVRAAHRDAVDRLLREHRGQVARARGRHRHRRRREVARRQIAERLAQARRLAEHLVEVGAIARDPDHLGVEPIAASDLAIVARPATAAATIIALGATEQRHAPHQHASQTHETLLRARTSRAWPGAQQAPGHAAARGISPSYRRGPVRECPNPGRNRTNPDKPGQARTTRTAA